MQEIGINDKGLGSAWFQAKSNEKNKKTSKISVLSLFICRLEKQIFKKKSSSDIYNSQAIITSKRRPKN